MHLQDLLEICGKHTHPDDESVVIPEAYVPYFPEEWNRFLVLAESQNLSATNDGYVAKLKALDPLGRMTRLSDRDGSGVGIAPWDDGSLKLAVESAFDQRAEATAVSNAVCWSRRGEGSINANPSPEMMEWAVAFWREMLPAIGPMRIITAGNVAHEVLEQVDRDRRYPRTRLRLPSPQAMSRVSGMFSRGDLLARYPEVQQVVERHADWGRSMNNIFYACHATSMAGRRALPSNQALNATGAAAPAR